YEKVALVTDTRDREGFGKLLDTIEDLRKLDDCTVRILYMDADTPTLIRRYKESRRPHPLAEKGMTTEEAVQKEEELLSAVRRKADYVVNSSSMTLGMLQNRLFSLFSGEERKRSIDVTVMSFGFKHGIPLEADLVFDARFLPNPFYVEELRMLSGLDRPVAEFVFGYPQTRTFLEKLEELIAFLLPYYMEEGKLNLTIAIGCTGGRHRSVALASALHNHLVANRINSVNVNRDIDK
ncbi:MAG: RNase adapter RapZ, partial [Oscillospiraceae bacterium]|nr:RNase adapter RapZ [Oscillospiraceae bacterium]